MIYIYIYIYIVSQVLLVGLDQLVIGDVEKMKRELKVFVTCTVLMHITSSSSSFFSSSSFSFSSSSAAILS